MSKNIEDLDYRALQQECARLGLNGKGTRQELSEKLDRFLNGEETQKVFVGEGDNADISPDEIVVENPEVKQDQILAVSEADEAKLRHEAQWEKLSIKLNLIFAGRVQFFLQTNSPGNYSVVFKGSVRRSECINLTAGHKTIEREAMRYIGRAAPASPTGGDTPDQAMKKFESTMNR